MFLLFGSSKSHAVKEKASGISHKDELERQIPAPRLDL